MNISGTMGGGKLKRTATRSFLVWRKIKLRKIGPGLSLGCVNMPRLRDIEKSFFHISGLSLAMPVVVMEKCGVLAPKSVRLLISMALDFQSPLKPYVHVNKSKHQQLSSC